jgi:outer membrane protein OmpA-like peptidoglycan-associated protein
MNTAGVILAIGLSLIPLAADAQTETELPGVTAELVELRQSGGVLRLAVRLTNGGASTVDSSRVAAGRIVLVDAKSRKKHFPMKDAEGHWLAGPIGDDIDGGRIVLRIPAQQATIIWAYFEPLTVGTVVNVEMPFMFPFDGVPVTDGPGKAFSSTAAKTTPGGGTATVASAKRADQALNVRLRLTPDRDPDLGLLDSYLRYKHVFLFDPVGKRKYRLLRSENEGDFQAQPLTVPGDGGSFVYDWRKTTLVNLTFQAPPDTVQHVDLLLPQFVPVEAIAIEGLGGAAPGGVETAGKTVGLDGALKALNANVTPKEIKIDLAADVLFDFDQATIKSAAEPTLRHLLTVLQANPGATVAIDGHTDGRGADDYNQKLSNTRAASVKQWLVVHGQADASKIATRGLGKSKPIAPNSKPDGSDDPEGRAKNRRVEIVVRKGA